MNRYGLVFHHLGLAVRRPSQALSFIRGMGYQHTEAIFDAEQNVNLILCTHGQMPTIEIIYPSLSRGPLESILKDHSEMFYHLCYTSNNMNNSIQKIKSENRVIMVSDIKPAILFEGRGVSFYKVAGFGLIEIIEDGSFS
ncbi:MAG: VOC family protein [Methylococcaceae bacterium]